MLRIGHLSIGDEGFSFRLKLVHFRLQLRNPRFSGLDGRLNLTDVFRIFQIELVIQVVKGFIFPMDTGIIGLCVSRIKCYGVCIGQQQMIQFINAV